MSFATLVVFAAAVASAAAQLQVNTPTSVQACLPVQLTWSSGVPPYYVGLINGGQPSSPIIKDFGQQTGTNLVWNVDQPVGKNFTVQIRDSTGTLNYSDQFQVLNSSQTCATSTSTGTGTSTTLPTGNTSISTTTPSTGSTTTPSTGKNSTGSGSTGTATTSTSTGSTGTSFSTNTTAATGAKSDADRVGASVVFITLSALVAVLA